MGGIYTSAHLIQINVHCVHGRSKIFHVSLASQYDALHMCSVTFRTVQHIFQLSQVVLDCIQLMRQGIDTNYWPVTITGTCIGAEKCKLLLNILCHNLQLTCDLCFKVVEPVRDFLQDLAVAGSTCKASAA